jgi:CBS domain-containing protein
MAELVRDIMDSTPVTVPPEASVEEVVTTLRQHELPGRLVGVLTRLDVLGAPAR